MDNYNGIWLYEELSNQVIFIFEKINSKIYKIYVNYPCISNTYFLPAWQRCQEDKIILKMKEKKDNKNTIEFYLIKDSINCVLKTFTDKHILLKKIQKEINNPMINYAFEKYEILYKFRLYKSKIDKNINFQYNKQNNERLIQLRNEFKLDNIIKGLDEEEASIKLMNWLNNKKRHSSNATIPDNRDGYSILKDVNKYTCCRGYAITLCDLLLSVGIIAKFITCLPFERDYNECHVITLAFIKKRKKWILLDATNNLYLYNSQNDLIDLSEFREAVIYGKYIYLNEDTNWNGKKVTLTEYVSYMSKNLIRFQTYLNIYAGCDISNNECIELVPDDYYNILFENNYVNINATITNPETFWKLPDRK